MSVSYSPLWKLLIDRNLSRADFRRITGISPNTLTKLNRNDFVSMDILSKICAALECDFKDIVTYITDKEEDINE